MHQVLPADIHRTPAPAAADISESADLPMKVRSEKTPSRDRIRCAANSGNHGTDPDVVYPDRLRKTWPYTSGFHSGSSPSDV